MPSQQEELFGRVNNRQQQVQQQLSYQQQQQQYNNEEYLAAQRSAVEAVAVGRATLEQAVQQSEQLERTELLADETQYTLDKAGRILRGMTWSGWVANAFSRSIGPAPQPKIKEPPVVYDETIPDYCRGAAQAIQNYHANIKVLQDDGDEMSGEQKETLQMICNAMYDTATQKLNELEERTTKSKTTESDAHVLEFRSHLAILRQRQQELSRPKQGPKAPPSAVVTEDRALLMPPGSTRCVVSTPRVAPIDDPRYQMQEEHLSVVSESLGELGSIAKSLSQVVGQQHEIIDSLDTKTDFITEKSKMVTRRADRIIQNKSWTPVKATFSHFVSIRHVATGRYLTVLLDGKAIVLQPVLHPQTAVFGVWKRQGEIFGLQNRDCRRWLGQNLLGSFACSATSFGRREEWEADDDTKRNKTGTSTDNQNSQTITTRLLCASAGWGAGGYIYVRQSDSDATIMIGGCGMEERAKADLWCLSEYKVAS